MKIPKTKHLLKFLRAIAFFTAIFYVASLVSYRTVYVLVEYIVEHGLTELKFIPKHVWPYVSTLVYSLAGSIFATFAFKYLIIPIYKFYHAFERISKGDFSVRVKPEGIKTIKQLGTRFNKMSEELESVETLRNDFINDFSHEFKTPIVSIAGFAKLLKADDTLTEKEKEDYLNIIINESSRLTELSTNVLRLSKIEKQAILTDQTTFNATEQIRRAIVLLDHKWQSKGTDFDCDFDEVYIRGNEELLQQLWINIIDNAIKFSTESPKITISVEENQHYVQFTFTDNGIGMDEKTKAHIFDKFYQGDSSHSTAGNGIGLPLAMRICQLHKGKIELESQVGKGTTFVITLPKENV